MARKARLISWEVKTELVERPNGWQRWDKAYQLLLEWTCLPAIAPSQPSDYVEESTVDKIKSKVGTKNESSLLCQSI